MASTLTFLGAARGVTGSCYLLRHGDDAIMIDCGTFQGSREEEAKNRERLPLDGVNLRAVVLTHGHLDHVGRSPVLAYHGYQGEVLGHPATLDIAKIILDDSAKINNHAEGDPLYGDEEVTFIKDRMRSLGGYRAPHRVGPFTLELFDAGHILGSSSVRVSWSDGGHDRAILFSGDLGVAGAPIIRDPNTAWDPELHGVDYVVTESTYGDRRHVPRAEVRANLRKLVERALRDGGKVLIPAFSIGRTQEVLYELNALVEAGELPRIPVIVDGPLGLAATRIYSKHTGAYDAETMGMLERGDKPFEFDGLVKADDPGASRKAVDTDGPAIIIAGSGMCQGGRIMHYLQRYLPDPRTDVLLVGYQAYRTLGRALQDGRDTVYMKGQEVEVRAKISTISGLSAHADRDGLTTWYGALPRRKDSQVFVTHGEPDQSEIHARRLTDQFGVRATVPDLYQTITLG